MTAAQARQHRLGLAGHFGNPFKFQGGIDEALQATAGDLGGVIGREGRNFTLEFPGGDGALDYKGDLAGINDYLRRLRQPERAGIEDAVRAQRIRRRGRAAQEERLLAHRILRYALTGSVVLPDFVHPSLKEEINSCHAETEQDMRDGVMWRTTPSIDAKGRAERYSPVMDKNPLEPAILPHTQFDPSKGYVFDLRQGIAAPDHVASELGAELEAWFWGAVRRATRNRYAGTRPEILHLSPKEMDAFCAEVHQAAQAENLEDLPQETEQQEKIGAAIARIQGHVPAIAQDKIFQTLQTGSPAGKIKSETRLKNLALASSALRSVMGSEALQERWRRYFYTKRNRPPMQEVCRKFERLEAVIQHFQAQGDITPELAEAIATDEEFYGLIAFGREALEILRNALEADESAKDEVRHLEMAVEILKQASLSGVGLDDALMDYNYEAVLDMLRRSTGQDDAPLQRIGKEFVANSVDFLSDIYTFPFKAPKQFLMVSLFATYLGYRMYGSGDAAAAPVAAAPPSAVIAGNSQAVLPGLEGLQDAGDLVKNLTVPVSAGQGGIEGIDWHRHPAPWLPGGYYRHYFRDLVEGTSRTFINIGVSGLRYCYEKAGIPYQQNSSFEQAADQAASHMGLYTYIANGLQNYGGHLFMFAGFGEIGRQNGLPGIRRVTDFFHGFHDAGRATVLDRPLAAPMALAGLIYDKFIPKGPGGDLSTGMAWTVIGACVGYWLSGKIWPKNLWPRKNPIPEEFSKALLNAAMQDLAAQEEQEMEDEAEIAVREARFSLKYSQAKGTRARLDNAARFLGLKNTGLGGEFHIDGKNYRNVMRSLQHMAMKIRLFPEQSGIREDAYREFLQQSLDSVMQALRDYQDFSITEKDLQHVLERDLREVIAAQIYLSPDAPVYEALTGKAPSDKAKGFLRRHGSHRHGHFRRIQSSRDTWQEIGEASARKASHMLRRDWYAALGEQVKIAGKSLKMDALPVLDKIAAFTRAAQNTYCNIPYKKQIFLGTVAATAGVAALDIAGYAGPGHEIVDALAPMAGVVTSVVTTTGVFLVVNTGDDQIVVHFALGSSCLVGGAMLYYAGKYGTTPLKNYAEEITRGARTRAAEAWKAKKSARQHGACPGSEMGQPEMEMV